MSDNTNRKQPANPKWLKRLARARMAETGEKYTQAIRRIKEEQESIADAKRD